MIHPPRKARYAVAALLAFAGIPALDALGVPAKSAAAQPPGRTLGFVVTWFYPAMYTGKEACPAGLSPKPTAEDYLKGLPEAERAIMSLPENTQKVYKAMVAKGPHGENICWAPALQDANARIVTLSGKTNVGLDLDHRAPGERPRGGPQCAPEGGFVSPTGERGVDNQVGRLLACVDGMGPTGFYGPYVNGMMRDGDFTMLIDVTGVDDVRNDDDVTVGFYSGKDPVPKDGGKGFLTYASLAVHPDKRYQTQVKGRIVDGVLETIAPQDMTFTNVAYHPAVNVRRGRLRLELGGDGETRGYLGGYLDWRKFYEIYTGDGFAEMSLGFSCSALYNTLKAMADENPDSQGNCSTISVSYDIRAVPAFVIKPTEPKRLSSRAR